MLAPEFLKKNTFLSYSSKEYQLVLMFLIANARKGRYVSKSLLTFTDCFDSFLVLKGEVYSFV